MKKLNWLPTTSFIFLLAICLQTAAVTCPGVYKVDPTVTQFHQLIRSQNQRLANLAEHYWDTRQVNDIVELIQKSPNQKLEFTTSRNLQVSGWYEISNRAMSIELTKVIKDGIELEKRHSGLNRDLAYLTVALLKFYHLRQQTGAVDTLQMVGSYVRNPMLLNLFSDLGFVPEQMVYDTMLRFTFQLRSSVGLRGP